VRRRPIRKLMPRPSWYIGLRAWGLRTFKQQTMLWLSLGCLVVDLLIAASTLAPGAPVVPQWPQFLLFPIALVVHFSSILRATPERGRLGWRQFLSFLAGAPTALLTAFIGLFIGVVLVVEPSINGLSGQPTISGGHYYLNNHGDFLPVTRAVYEHALVLQQRIFTLVPSVFFALGVLTHYPRTGVGAEAAAHA
jgi:hypothetical protein